MTDPVEDLFTDKSLTLVEDNPAPPTFQGYVTHVKTNVDPSVYLGFLVWYHVPESCTAVYQDYLDLIERTGAPIHVGTPPKASNVFRRGCKISEKRHHRVETDDPDIFYHYHCRDAGQDVGKWYKRLFREAVDAEDHSIAFTELGGLTFTRETSHIKGQPTSDGAQDQTFGKIVQEVRSYVRDNALVLTAYALREGLRTALVGPQVRATLVNGSGALYFASRDVADTLSQIEHLTLEMPGMGFEIVPLPDDARQRGMVREAFQQECIEGMQRLVARIAELSESGKQVTEDQYVRLMMEFGDQRGRVEEYSSLLDDSLAEGRVACDVAEAQLTALRKRVAT